MSYVSDNKSKYYTHASREESQAFLNGYLLAAVMKRTDDSNIAKLYNNEAVADADAKKKANTQLFAIMIGMIDNDKLVTALANTCPSNGQEAIQT